MQKALQILKKYWGYDSFRPVQEDIIQSVINGSDTFGLMPTGGGKSLCFQIPAMLSDGMCLVISPLVALMKDQVLQLQKRDIKAIALTGGIHSEELIQLLDNCQYGNYKFLYLSPERLEQEWVLERIKGLNISLIAIDEAHCVSQWGHDFRPSYLKIIRLKDFFSKTPFIAVTASATLEVQLDIVSLLGLEEPKVFKKSFSRENLGYHIIKAEDKFYKIKQILTKNPEPSIIYVRNRKLCIEVANELNSLGFQSTYYHGGLPLKEKEKNMQLWMTEKTPVMIATSAFGMGIDKPNVKTVIHINLPENLESYYQEAGRAGRNGEKSFAILITSSSDIIQAENQFISVLPEVNFLKEVYVKLCNYFQIPYGEGINDEFSFSLNQFCSKYNLPILKTFNSIQFLDRQSIISMSSEQSEKAQIQFVIESREIIRYISLNPNEEPILTTILRNYPGVFDMPININTVFVAKSTNNSELNVITLLESLRDKGIINLVLVQNESKITFLEVREDDRTINRVAKYLEKQNLNKKNQLASVVTYVSDDLQCKNRLLLTYFGETVEKDCGICSYCLTKKSPIVDNTVLREKIINNLKKSPRTSRELSEVLNSSQKEIIEVLKQLLEHNKISMNSKNQFTIN